MTFTEVEDILIALEVPGVEMEKILDYIAFLECKILNFEQTFDELSFLVGRE